MLVKQPDKEEGQNAKSVINNAMDLDLNCLVEKPLNVPERKTEELKNDDVLVNIGDDVIVNSTAKVNHIVEQPSLVQSLIKEPAADGKKLKISDIFVELEHIRPSSIRPLTVLDEKNGITVTLHFAKDKPRDDVNVIVVTSVSKNELPLSNYLFQAVVPKVFTYLLLKQT